MPDPKIRKESEKAHKSIIRGKVVQALFPVTAHYHCLLGLVYLFLLGLLLDPTSVSNFYNKCLSFNICSRAMILFSMAA